MTTEIFFVFEIKFCENYEQSRSQSFNFNDFEEFH